MMGARSGVMVRVVAGLLFPAVVGAQQCYEYRREDASGWHFDHVAACSEGLPRDDAPQSCGAGTFHFRFRYAGFEGNSGSYPVTGMCVMERVSVGVSGTGCGFPIGGEGGAVEIKRQLSHRIAAECPGGECEDSTSRYTKGFSSGWPGPGEYCEKSSNCVVQRIFAAGDGGKGYSVYQATGQTCGSQDEYDGGPDDEKACVVIGGQTLCSQPEARNCGTINGEYVCLGDHPDAPAEDGCRTLSGGGRVCGPEAPVPPAPDNGTPGVPADPDMEVDVHDGGSTNHYNYYNWNTVQGSSDLERGGGGAPGCDPAVDAGCVDIGRDWVDRDYTPPGVPTFDGDAWEGLDGVAGKWADTQGESAGKVGEFRGFLQGTFPFSLFASPLTAFGGSSTPPDVGITIAGHSASAPMDAFDELFALVRVASGLLLLFGFWMLLMATIRNWSK